MFVKCVMRYDLVETAIVLFELNVQANENLRKAWFTTEHSVIDLIMPVDMDAGSRDPITTGFRSIQNLKVNSHQ